MAERKYLLRGVSMTAAEVAALENVTDDEKAQFAKQAGLSDSALQQIEAMGQALAPAIKKYVRECVSPLVDRLLVLEAKGYKGVHQRAQSYPLGSIVTHKRAAWIALKNTDVGDIPDESPSWQLFVPAGRDGKDAK